MQLIVDGKTILLRDKEVQIAGEALRRFLAKMKEGATENNMPTLYIAVLAVMQVKATNLLNSLDAEQFNLIVSLLEKDQESSNGAEIHE